MQSNFTKKMVDIFVNKIGSKLSPEAINAMNKETSFIDDLRALSVKWEVETSLARNHLSPISLADYNSYRKAPKVKIDKLLEEKKRTPSWGDFCWPVEENHYTQWQNISLKKLKALREHLHKEGFILPSDTDSSFVVFTIISGVNPQNWITITYLHHVDGVYPIINYSHDDFMKPIGVSYAKI